MRKDDPALPALRDGCVITVGAFDGVHLGHRDILDRLGDRGRDAGLPSVLLTFRPHPLAVVNPAAAPRLLTPGDEQLRMVAAVRAPDCAVVIPFTPRLAAFSAEQFVRELLLARYKMQALVIGYDHGLGRGREGNVAALAALGKKLGFPVDVVPARATESGLPVSSTAIRRAVAYGDLDTAAALLGRPYTVEGVVGPGAGRGRELGYPTLNVSVPSEKLLPPEGVYAVRVWSVEGQQGGMMNLGGRPTFGDFALSIEVHVFEASGDWTGRCVAVEFVSRLRDVVQFAGREALVTQLGRDEEAARRALTQA